MAENITSFYDLYNRANDAGKATDIQADDLFVLQRGTGSNRNKCIKGSDIKASTGLVIVSSYSESNPVDIPEPLRNKLYNSDTINFDDTTVSGNKKIVAELRTNSVDTAHLKESSVTTLKINNLAVTTNKIGNNAVTTAKINDGAVGTTQIADVSVTKEKIPDGEVSAKKMAIHVISKEDDDVVTDEGNFTKSMYTYDDATNNGIPPGGILDVTVTLECGFGSSESVGFSNVALEIRNSLTPGQGVKTYRIGVPEQGKAYSRRFVMRNPANASANAFYALVVTGTFTDTTSQGVTPIIGNILSDGIIVK